MLNKEQETRYSRQISLKEIGSAGQEKLLQSKVLVIGAGGLGSPALYYLAGAGIGILGIADFDTVGLSNLPRQILYATGEIGQKKTDSAVARLQSINSDLKVEKYPLRLNVDNIEDIVQNYDLIIDATDNFPTRYLVSDCCYLLNKPLIEGAALGFSGTVMTILPGESPCYRCLYPAPPQDGVVLSGADVGIMGMVAGTIGSIQALEAVKILLGKGRTLSGRLLCFDGLELGFREIELQRNLNCPLCGDHPVIHELVQYEVQCKTKKI
jgi:molybdopterin/thiamine biosynthesis adenylyltransferase